MIPRRAALALMPAVLLAGGCVAAAIPVVAGGMIARDKLREREQVGREANQSDAASEAELKTAQARAAIDAMVEKKLRPAAATGLPAPGTPIPTALTALPPPGGAAGAGEDAAISLQAYQALWTHLAAQVAKRKQGEAVRSVVLDPGAALDAPRYMPCEDRPLAIVMDIDENPSKTADPDARWRRWKGDGSDELAAVPGAVEGVEAARREGVSVIFTSARDPSGAPGVAAALDWLGFGPVEAGTALRLRGAAPADDMRQKIAADHCVVALIGDSFADFSDLLPAADAGGKPPAAVTDNMVAPLWGAGWFLLPNPVRSTIRPSSNPSGGE